MNTLPNSMHEVLGLWEVFIVSVACVPLVALIVGCMCYVMMCSRHGRTATDVPLTHRPHYYVRGLPPLLYRPYMPQA